MISGVGASALDQFSVGGRPFMGIPARQGTQGDDGNWPGGGGNTDNSSDNDPAAGGGGGYGAGFVSVVPGTTVTITVGAKGAGAGAFTGDGADGAVWVIYG